MIQQFSIRVHVSIMQYLFLVKGIKEPVAHGHWEVKVLGESFPIDDVTFWTPGLGVKLVESARYLAHLHGGKLAYRLLVGTLER